MSCNTQVTFDTSINSARSECAISVNARNPSNIVGESTRFTNPSAYDLSLAAYASFDGGKTWSQPRAGDDKQWARATEMQYTESFASVVAGT